MAEITEVRIYKTKGDGKQKAFAAVTLDSEFVVHGLRVLESEKGPWIGFPARKDSKGEFQDIFHPINKEAREKITKAVVDAYSKEVQSTP